MIEKQRLYIARLEKHLFIPVGTVSVSGYQTTERLDSAPTDVKYTAFKKGDRWGGERTYCWFKGEYTVPSEFAGKRFYLCPECGMYEGLLFVNDLPYANYATKHRTDTGFGNHYFKAFTHDAVAGETYFLVLEAYSGRNIEGNMPYAEPTDRNFDLVFDEFKVMVRDELINEFYVNYKILMELYDCQAENSPKRAEIEGVLSQLNEIVYFSDGETDKEMQKQAMTQAIEIMNTVLSKKNSATTASVGITGHSHMDTAWLWEIDETIKKCARTFANQLNLMDRFPNYHFIQSSAAHLKFIEVHYPILFEEIKKRIAQGRYEPNGGVWIECDCNITGGEFMVRHFLWGQQYTKDKFGYTSNAFFLPDTFGYSAAIPQILKGVGIDYFLTTKMDWNDTNIFPYTTFYWQGIDGSRVLAHNNITHRHPTPKTLTDIVDDIKQKSVSHERLLTHGFGDGGGGPEDSMIEIASKLSDLEGCPRVYDTTVGEFMVKHEKSLNNPNTFVGELYLELHRGTLTNQHTIKRNNRKAETAIRNAEYFTCMRAMSQGAVASSENIAPLVETLLVNQFHDILPGTCVPEANDQSIRETTEVIEKADNLVDNLLVADGDGVTVYNTLSSARRDVMILNSERYLDVPCHQQMVQNMSGEKELHLSGLTLEGFESNHFSFTEDNKEGDSPFIFTDNVLTTPFAIISFDTDGSIKSFVDRRVNRELKGSNHNLNTFLFGEDLPYQWDNWDIDADCEMNLKPCVKLEDFTVVSDGSVEFRIRAKYTVSPLTTMTQDMVFYSESERVDFETVIDWNDKHRLLKTVFDTSIYADYATQEIQFGNVKRSTKRNNSFEQAQFEVCNHKYSDLSEPGYGVALLNDCKYGISLTGTSMSLTLHKGGCKPDPRGDKGVHEFKYSFYPHLGGFSAKTVVANAYNFNNPIIAKKGAVNLPKLLCLDKENIIVESVKPCEDNEKAMIVRLYESEGSYTTVTIDYHTAIKDAIETNLLEIPKEGKTDCRNMTFRPFEIRTVRLGY